jgi:hypothetical protein
MFPAAEIHPFYGEQEPFHPKHVLSQYGDRCAIAQSQLSPLGRKLLGLENWI